MAPQEINYDDQFNVLTPKTLTELISALKEELGPDGSLDSKHVDVNHVKALMEAYTSNATDWQKYALFDKSRSYTRNLVDDGNGKFNLIVLAWTEGQGSPIHDHAGSHCVMKVLDGQLSETIYEWPDSVAELCNIEAEDITSAPTKSDANGTENACRSMSVMRSTTLDTDDVTYIHDKIGLHRIANPSNSKGAVSLHLYTPPYDMCKTFNESTGAARSSGRCVFYSKGGQRIDAKPLRQAQAAADCADVITSKKSSAALKAWLSWLSRAPACALRRVRRSYPGH
ncbi:cysteine dioxygenase, type I [Endogone sp. FLAS-F59071]|nr:cysteine dioxygenase, type I [Endogone sp. FLAS-F59071]|eukprot:RUS15270.1 cysteine dioxygenase, type I [Endogone sp. FLAS-F59071]